MTLGPWRSNAEPIQGSTAVFGREFLKYLSAIASGANVSSEEVAALRELLENSGLSDLNGLSGVGLVVKRDGGLSVRTITGTNRVAVQNGNGVLGNPILDLRASGVTADTYGGAAEIPVLTIDEYGRITLATTAPADSSVPYLIPDGETYTVRTNKQALFAMPIAVGASSTLAVDGFLIEVN